jgi:hypothetical protein
MTVVRTTRHMFRTVLDFSGERCSKNKIEQSLRTLEVMSFNYDEKTNTNLTVENYIRVGIFDIQLILSVETGTKKLRAFDGMCISIRERNKNYGLTNYESFLQERANYKRLFGKQYWNQYNSMSEFKIAYLVDAIDYCQRLNNLKAFL